MRGEAPADRRCTLTGCDRPFLAKGFCKLHYRRWTKHGDPYAGMVPDLTVLQRLEATIVIGPPVRDLGACLICTSAPSAPRGFIKIDGKMRIPARVAWELVNGPIPSGLFVCHHCDVPRCLRPSHWFLGTPAENTADMITKARNANQVKDACPAGHLYDEANTYIAPASSSGAGRQYRTCARLYQQMLRARRRAAV